MTEEAEEVEEAEEAEEHEYTAAPAPPDPDDRLVLDPDCSRCPTLTADRNRIAWGVGPRDATVVVVGEAPGTGQPDADEWRGGNWTGMAYTTRHSGRRIRRLLASAGFAGECFYTNAVKCVPLDEEGDLRDPTPDERATCRSHLRAELSVVKPAVIVTTGRHATASVFAMGDRSLDGFLETVLEPHDVAGAGAPVVPLLHPSYRDVWAGRLGYEPDEYEAAVRETLQAVVASGTDG